MKTVDTVSLKKNVWFSVTADFLKVLTQTFAVQVAPETPTTKT